MLNGGNKLYIQNTISNFFFIVKNTYYILINGGRGKHPRTKLLPDVIGSKQ